MRNPFEKFLIGDSIRHLQGLNEEFARRVTAFILEARAEGLRVDVHKGMRTWEEQARLYAKGRTTKGKIVTNARPGSSWHNYGLAVDVVFVNSFGRFYKDSWGEKQPWGRLGEIGKSHFLDWGGDWRRFKDRPHFQMTNGLKISEAKRIYRTEGLEGVWKRVEGI